MKGVDLFEVDQWLIPVTDHPFFYVNIKTVVHTWIVLAILFFFLILARLALSKHDSIARFMAVGFVQFFMDLLEQSSAFTFNNFVFITTIFSFTLACNLVSIIPWMHEPTTDLNTTLALSLVAFFYTQIAAIKKAGLWGYIQSYFSPFFLMLPLNIVGKCATVISISFRLFGNIFGGSIISSIYFGAIQGNVALQLVGLITGINILITLFFGIFEGFLQAYVFAMLALTYLSLSLQEGGH